ncbi:hypothetical protein M8J75_010326 [Diaphorina citri]|nr:hypothetical protein M8J75_010326 [Diaphorina citri]
MDTSSDGLSTENPTSSTHDLREQIIQYWSQAVDEDVKDVTVLFLRLKKENKRLFEGSMAHAKAWGIIAEKLVEKGFPMPGVTSITEGGKRCKVKWDNLMRSFRDHQKHLKSTGAGRKKAPRYFEEMEDATAEFHHVNPTIIIDSMATPLSSRTTTSLTSSTSFTSQQSLSSCPLTSFIPHSLTSQPSSSPSQPSYSLSQPSSSLSQPSSSLSQPSSSLSQPSSSLSQPSSSQTPTSQTSKYAKQKEQQQKLLVESVGLQRQTVTMLEKLIASRDEDRQHRSEMVKESQKRHNAMMAMLERVMAPAGRNKRKKKRSTSSDESS